MKKFTSILGIVLLIVFGLYTVRTFFSSGFFPMHDDTQPARVYQMAKSISDGQIPVRWVEDLGYGYGYPIFNFYGPLAYYIGGFFNLIGFEVLTATKIMMGFGMIFSGISMYFLAKELWGKAGGFISGLLYLLAPYHALNLYVRGDVAEMYAYSFLPLLFLAVWKLLNVHNNSVGPNNDKVKGIKSILKKSLSLYSNQWKWITFGSLSYAAIITSHNLTAMMVTLFLLLFIAFNWLFKPKRSHITLKHLFFTLVLGIILSSFYWIPVLAEMHYTNVLSQIGGKADYRIHFVCLPQIWDSPWGFGGSAPGCIDGMSFKLGKIHLIFMLITVIGLPLLRKKDKKIFNLVLSLLLIFVLSTFLMLQNSILFWDNIPFMKYFQYPWRFLIMATFATSLLGGAVFYTVNYFSSNKKYIQLLWFGLCILTAIAIFILNSKLFVPQTLNDKTASDYISENNLKWTISKISDEYLPRNFTKPQSEDEIVKQKFVVMQGDAIIMNEVTTTKNVSADINSHGESTILIRNAYFPAWKLNVNGKNQEYKIVENGILVNLATGRSHLRLNFEQTPIEKTANLFSFSGMLVLLTVIIGGRRKYE